MARLKLTLTIILFPFSFPEEIDGLDQENILDDEKGIKTRGVEQDVYAEERKLDEVLGDD